MRGVGLQTMPGIITPTNSNVRGYKGRISPEQGRVTVYQDLDFSAVAASIDVATAYIFDFGNYRANGLMDVPRSVFIDNSVNPNQLFVDVSQTSQNFPVAPFTVGMFPIFAQDMSTVTIYSLGGASDLVTVEFYNTEEAPWSNSAFSPLVPGFNVQTQPPAAKTVTNENTQVNAAAAVNVIPAGAVASRMIMFRNVGNDVVYWNDIAVANGTFANGDSELQPGPQWFVMPYGTAHAISFYLPAGGSASVNIEAKVITF